jgi:hypothetical protein
MRLHMMALLDRLKVLAMSHDRARAIAGLGRWVAARQGLSPPAARHSRRDVALFNAQIPQLRKYRVKFEAGPEISAQKTMIGNPNLPYEAPGHFRLAGRHRPDRYRPARSRFARQSPGSNAVTRELSTKTPRLWRVPRGGERRISGGYTEKTQAAATPPSMTMEATGPSSSSRRGGDTSRHRRSRRRPPATRWDVQNGKPVRGDDRWKRHKSPGPGWRHFRYSDAKGRMTPADRSTNRADPRAGRSRARRQIHGEAKAENRPITTQVKPTAPRWRVRMVPTV